MTLPTPTLFSRLSVWTALIAILCLGSCTSLRKKKAIPVKDHISATVEGKTLNYQYNITGTYDSTNNLVILQAFDTTTLDAKMFAITFTLGPSRLDTMRMPHLFSEKMDAHNKQTQYAHIAWDASSPDGLLLDNFTYREKTNLQIWLDSRKGDVLTGRFQGLLYNYKDKVLVNNGEFKVKIVRK